MRLTLNVRLYYFDFIRYHSTFTSAHPATNDVIRGTVFITSMSEANLRLFFFFSLNELNHIFFNDWNNCAIVDRFLKRFDFSG